MFLFSVEDYFSSDLVLPSSVRRDDVTDFQTETSENQSKLSDLNQVRRCTPGYGGQVGGKRRKNRNPSGLETKIK